MWIIWGPLLYFTFKSFVDPKSLSFLRLQCILHGSRLLFSESSKFWKLKMGIPNFWGETVLQKSWIIWSPFLCFKFKRFLESNILSFIRFQWTVHHLGVPFYDFWISYKLKSGELISGGSQFYRIAQLFVPPFCISSLNV